MGTILKVLRFNEDHLCSECKVISSDDLGFYVGQEIKVDLTVNADFGEMPESKLTGKTVEVERFQPCEFIGVNVKVISEGERHER